MPCLAGEVKTSCSVQPETFLNPCSLQPETFLNLHATTVCKRKLLKLLKVMALCHLAFCTYIYKVLGPSFVPPGALVAPGFFLSLSALTCWVDLIIFQTT